MNMSPALESALRPISRVQKIIWGAMTTGKLIYIVVLAILVRSEAIPEIQLPKFLPFAFGVIGTILAVTSIILWRTWNSADYMQKAMEKVSIPKNDNSSDEEHRKPLRLLPEGFAALDEPEKRLVLVFQELMRKMIICLSLNDVLAAFGLVTGLCGRQLGQAVPFILAAILANLFIYPRSQDQIKEIPELPNSA